MTNYETLFQKQLKDPEFAKAYREAKLELLLNDFLENLAAQITDNEPKEMLLGTIDAMRQQLQAVNSSH